MGQCNVPSSCCEILVFSQVRPVNTLEEYHFTKTISPGLASHLKARMIKLRLKTDNSSSDASNCEL